MSFTALAWASKQKTGGMATKAVLMALANFADENGCAYPATSTIADIGEMDHKTATIALDKLASGDELAFVEDTGERVGRTKQIKVYRLRFERSPETEGFPNRKASVSPSKAPQKRGTEPVKEPTSKFSSKTKRVGTPARPSMFPSEFVPVMTGKTADTVSGWPPGRLDDELEHFADYHRANAKTSADWQASWRTWVKNARKWEPRNAGNRNSSSQGGKSGDGFVNALFEAKANLARSGN